MEWLRLTISASVGVALRSEDEQVTAQRVVLHLSQIGATCGEPARRVAGLSVAFGLESVRSASRQPKTENTQAEQLERARFRNGSTDGARTEQRPIVAGASPVVQRKAALLLLSLNTVPTDSKTFSE